MYDLNLITRCIYLSYVLHDLNISQNKLKSRFFSLLGQDIKALESAARTRKRHAFRTGTISNHNAQITLYIAFCVHFSLEYVNPTSKTLCVYAEFLARSFRAPQAIRNYISGVRFLHKYINVESTALDSFELHTMLRALDLTMPHRTNRRLPITQSMLLQLSQACHSLGTMGLVLKVALLFGYYGFLRQSNLAPRSVATFNPRYHTCRGDVLLRNPGVVVIIKWTKTLQRGERAHLVPLPARPGHPLCPLRAYNDMLKTCPTLSPSPIYARIK